MNSMIGKSTGIALLMAAALLAALFATGVFAPAGVGAIKGTPKPTATLSETAYGTTGVTLTVTFEVNDDVNNSQSKALKVVVPSTVTASIGTGEANDDSRLAIDKIKVEQGGVEVGRVVYDPEGALAVDDYAFYIVEPASDDQTTPILAEDTLTTLTISGLTLVGSNTENSSGTVRLTQGSDTVQSNTIAVGPIVTAFSVELSNYEVEAAKVAATLKVTSDSVATSSKSIVVNMPPTVSIITTGTTLTEGISVETSLTGVTPTYGNDTTNGDTITIASGNTADTEFTVTVSGLTNPSAKSDLEFKVSHGASSKTDKAKLVDKTAVKLVPDVAGGVAQITIDANAGTAIDDTTQIVVDLKKFGVPASISEKAVLIYDVDGDGSDDGTTAGDGYQGQPTSVSVSGTKVTLTLPATIPNAGSAGVINTDVTDAYKVTFRLLAGITNPAKAGEATIELTDADGKEEKKVAVKSAVKLSEKSGVRGTVTTATLVGFEDGTATVHLETGSGADVVKTKLGEVTVASNTGTLAIDTTSTKFVTGKDANMITVEDSSGAKQGVAGKFTISPNLALSPAETKVSKDIKLNLSDWDAAEVITKVQIGASVLEPDTATEKKGLPMAAADRTVAADGTLTLTVKVPSTTNRGTQTVKVTGTKDTDPETAGVQPPTAKASLTVGVLALDVSPAMAVPGQEITITGTGFESDDEISEVTVGGKTLTLTSNVEASSSGDIVITIKVPSRTDETDGKEAGIGSGTKAVSVATTASGSGRVAEGSIEIPKAAITLDPMESRRATTVTVSGSGFPAGDLVQVTYAGTLVKAAGSDNSGMISTEFAVPSSANIGKEHEVKATSVGVYKPVSAKAKHSTPGAMVTLSADKVSSGGSITITGMNFSAFSTVAEMILGGQDVRPVPAPATSVDGDFESTVRVPGLDLGNQTVRVRVGTTTITTFVEVVAEAVAPAPDPSITIAPASGIMAGSTITVTGMDFAAGAVVRVEYDGTLVDAPTAGDDGGISVTHTVPADAEAGEVTVTAGSVSAKLMVEAAPEPEPEPVMAEVMADPAEATVGDMITISGSNMAANQSVIKLTVGDASVLPAGLITDTEGSFSVEVAAPDAEGEQTITVVVAGSDPVTGTVTIMQPISTDPAEVFAGVNGLTRAWHLDAETQTWTFYDPDAELFANVPEDRKLSMVASGQVYTLIVSEAGEFQGKALFVGTNQVYVP